MEYLIVADIKSEGKAKDAGVKLDMNKVQQRIHQMAQGMFTSDTGKTLFSVEIKSITTFEKIEEQLKHAMNMKEWKEPMENGK